ncbi:hypothetical protein KQI68_07085 [Peptoniphilus sp. MSJ-1]|uniref:Phage protein n=1 Tax=Peptoniphilus ovalis TaxID=2841503 RepID=A0ABS6FJC3_9FIRM|nr:hypothetical protein [Peptoniphilus ovalis]MBU5669602.1 hypothetical protein [Peptoniphilus ovalis]
MIFKIERTSDFVKHNQDKCPIKEAYKGKIKGKEWFLIEIKTIEELLELENKYGELIITTFCYDFPTIEIYDYYRE